MSAATFQPGALVKARGREWVVLPESTDQVLMIRPLGGLDEEVVGICAALEKIESASFTDPNPDQPGDFNSCRLLRDAAKISTRSAAGPFRSFAKVAVEPRPYQLVPLLMAMRLDTVRMLIADDVGIGKTIEACLIAKELIERGEVNRMAVLCPPHLAEQWQKELKQKFHIDAELVLSSTVGKLERGLRVGESLFDRHPFVIVSIDFIKSVKRRDDFRRACPELVIVDEAHTCAHADRAGASKQARFELLKMLSRDADRHMLLVTATPHSGNESAFRSLLSLVDEKFADLPHDMEADSRSALRAELAKHLVQRLRKNVIDLDKELGSTTNFPDREDKEESYKLSKEYKALFTKILSFASELVQDNTGTGRNRRVRWWSALALLRAMASSPAAAAATLRKRALNSDEDANDAEYTDTQFTNMILDQDDPESEEYVDITPGADTSEEGTEGSIRLRKLAAEAEKLQGSDDAKLQKITKLVKDLVKDGYNPILFCRFIDTAEYVAAHLRDAIKNVEVAAVTGLLPPQEREDRIKELAEHSSRILVCTDCLSEGINLQGYFNAVIHYDLSWNPTRHEQREGRVDRFGQPKKTVRVLTYFGVDNQIDGIVLDVLLRKHKKIKSDLGISVQVPGGSEDVMKALFEGMELRGGEKSSQMFFPGMDPVKEKLHADWEDAREKEKRSRSRFAQLSIKIEEVGRELTNVREAIGAGPTVERLFNDILHLANIPVKVKRGDIQEIVLSETSPRAIRHAIGRDTSFLGRFELPVEEDVEHLSRTHPIVEGLASYALEVALDPVQAEGESPLARRCGVAKTKDVSEKTSMFVVRLRYQIYVQRRGRSDDEPLLAEEVCTIAFTGGVDDPRWLSEEDSRHLTDIKTSGNLPPALVKQQLKNLIDNLPVMKPRLDAFAVARANELKNAHTRIRKSAKMTGQVQVNPMGDMDILGCYILLPDNQ